jgi:hypothetical protein
MYSSKLFVRLFSKTCLIACLVFKVGLLRRVLDVNLLCVLFKDKFAKVVKIAKDVIRLLRVLFKEKAMFA